MVQLYRKREAAKIPARQVSLFLNLLPTPSPTTGTGASKASRGASRIAGGGRVAYTPFEDPAAQQPCPLDAPRQECTPMSTTSQAEDGGIMVGRIPHGKDWHMLTAIAMLRQSDGLLGVSAVSPSLFSAVQGVEAGNGAWSASRRGHFVGRDCMRGALSEYKEKQHILTTMHTINHAACFSSQPPRQLRDPPQSRTGQVL